MNDEAALACAKIATYAIGEAIDSSIDSEVLDALFTAKTALGHAMVKLERTIENDRQEDAHENHSF